MLDDRLKEKIKRIKLLILDVDGVLTDGSINYTDDGREFKSFNVKDGHGIKLLMRAGVEVALITARESNVVVCQGQRSRHYGCLSGQKEKLGAFEEILAKKGLDADRRGLYRRRFDRPAGAQKGRVFRPLSVTR